MQTITLIIKNGYDTVKKVSVLDTILSRQKNCGLPPKVEISIENNFEKDLVNKYFCLLDYITCRPFQCSIISSTNNRQLSFFCKEFIFGTKIPMMPHLDIHGEPREKRYFEVCVPDSDEKETDWEYVEKWNPKKWNIADTHERFIMTFAFVVDVVLEPRQEFKLVIGALGSHEADLGNYTVVGFNKQYIQK